ncbi:MAG: asparagine synthase (glutamine-hydrolyzing) [Anaerolineales bacterium]|jgi:asparagine synthase (glutamine-hydrolysing)
MCGITGFITRSTSEYTIDRDTLTKMTRSLIHRGPDDEGYFWSPQIGLGSRRLSIIDLSPLGRMPIWNEDKTIAVVQNGEIYNYLKIRDGLQARGHCFISHTDTETIVHLYEEVGEKCFEQFDGMFAIAIWDSGRKRLLLARDRFGEKPLYYYQHSGGIVFASELKALVLSPGFCREINWQVLDQFLSLGYILSPQTPYHKTWKLLPGHYLVADQETGDVRTHEFWNPPDSSHPASGVSEAEYVAEFKELFFESVKSRMVSDVPVGAFLSGGIDSSLVVSSMVKIQKERVRTFSIGFEFSPKYNENRVAEQVAQTLGVEHTTLWVNSTDVFGLIEKLPWLLDDPNGDPALLAAYLITQKAREAGFKVMLSGDGGDELFWGYPVFNWLSRLEPFYRLPRSLRKSAAFCTSLTGRALRNSRFEKGSRALAFGDLMTAAYYLTGYGAWPPDGTPTISTDRKANLSSSSFALAYSAPLFHPRAFYREANALMITYLPENTQARMDRVSMANSLETRAPFLNPAIAEFAARLPLDMKLRGSTYKYVLRKALCGFVSPEIVNRPKHGFNALPMEMWLRNELNFLVRDYLDPARLRRQGLFDAAMVKKTVDQHMQDGLHNHWLKLWLLIVVQMWLERWANL